MSLLLALIGGEEPQPPEVEATYSQEIELRPWYIRRNKKILLFNTARQADAYLEAEEAAEEAIHQAQKTSRRARKRIREKIITVEPAQSVDIDWLADAVTHFSIPVDLPTLIAQEDMLRVVQLVLLAQELQEEEDIELLLLS